jgi:SAM-dependent methyltransferase
MHCPCCPGVERRAVGAKDGFALFECAVCSLLYVDPMPDDETLARFYRHYHKTAQYTAKLDAKRRRAARRIRRLSRRVRGNRFLDVGCNAGFAVEAARQAGFDATGIDIDTDAIAQAQTLFPAATFEAISLEALAATGQTWDLVYCSEVIEHLRRPRDFVAALAGVVAPGGLLFLTTPDMGHFTLPRDRLAWDNVRPPEHLLYFNRRSLRRLLGTQGFIDVRIALNFKPTLKVTARRV